MKKFILYSLIILFIIYSTCFFNYVGWNPTLAGWFSYFLYVFIVSWTYLNRKKITIGCSTYSKGLWLLMLYPLLGVLLRYVSNDDYSLYNERQYILPLAAFLFYYIYSIYSVSEKDIVNIFTGVSFLIFGIQVFQIIFPEMAVFGIYDEEMQQSRHAIAEIRNGIYRFRLPGSFFTLFCLYYYWNRLLVKINMRDLIYCAVLLCSGYLYLTRQIIFATLLTLIFSFVFVRNHGVRLKIIIITVACCFVGLYFADDLFSEFYEKSFQSGSYDIRLVAGKFYLEKIFESPLTFLFGSGHPEELKAWTTKLSLYPEDVGLIGEMFYYGLFWILFYFYMVYIIVARHSSMLPLYIKSFVFGTFVNSIMIFPYRSSGEYLVWATVFYLATQYLAQSADAIPTKANL